MNFRPLLESQVSRFRSWRFGLWALAYFIIGLVILASQFQTPSASAFQSLGLAISLGFILAGVNWNAIAIVVLVLMLPGAALGTGVAIFIGFFTKRRPVALEHVLAIGLVPFVIFSVSSLAVALIGGVFLRLPEAFAIGLQLFVFGLTVVVLLMLASAFTWAIYFVLLKIVPRIWRKFQK
jgi:hypothetical protein